MRYDLLLHKHDSTTRYIGTANGKAEAVSWALTRLRREDARYGDLVTAHKLGEKAPAFTIDSHRPEGGR